MSEEQLIAEVGISTVCMKRMDMSTSELASCITWKLQKKKKIIKEINQKSIFLTRSDIHAMRLMNPGRLIISVSDHDLKSCSEQER